MSHSHSKPFKTVINNTGKLRITLGSAAANRRNMSEEQMRCLARIHGHLSSNCSRGLPALPNMRGKRRPTMQHDKIIRPYPSKCHLLMAKTESWRWLEVWLSDRAIFYGNCSFLQWRRRMMWKCQRRVFMNRQRQRGKLRPLRLRFCPNNQIFKLFE